MTQEEKQLLLKDLCARLPYFTIAYVTYKEGSKTMEGNQPVTTDDIDMLYESVDAIEEAHYTIKPYLRPMLSMTEEEKEEQSKIVMQSMSCSLDNSESATTMLNDWLLSKHFDVRGLISKGLALEAPEGMYKTE